jgi:hypothetical protein
MATCPAILSFSSASVICRSPIVATTWPLAEPALAAGLALNAVTNAIAAISNELFTVFQFRRSTFETLT